VADYSPTGVKVATKKFAENGLDQGLMDRRESKIFTVSPTGNRRWR